MCNYAYRVFIFSYFCVTKIRERSQLFHLLCESDEDELNELNSSIKLTLKKYSGQS